MLSGERKKAVCILHANCLGDALRPLLESIPSFSRYFTIRRFTNYTRDIIDHESLENCNLYLYQYLAPKWGELSSEYMLGHLPGNCTSIEIPNFLFRGYWPYWIAGDSIISFCNGLLEKLLDRGLTPAEVLHIYLKGAPEVLGDVTAIALKSIQDIAMQERDKPVRYAHILENLWREEQLFITVNHPNKRLIFHVASAILQLLGLGEIPDSIMASYSHPYDDFWQPIHPAVGKANGLNFVSETRRYRVYHNLMTHAEYSRCYLACRAHGERDFLTMLQDLPADYRTP